VITNCIGAGCKNSFLDIYEFTDDFLSGDLYLLCSDGLNDMVPDEEIERLLVDGASANRLCEAAIEAGGYDNVSTCVISVK
jgi:protein phosphatase